MANCSARYGVSSCRDPYVRVIGDVRQWSSVVSAIKIMFLFPLPLFILLSERCEIPPLRCKRGCRARDVSAEFSSHQKLSRGEVTPRQGRCPVTQ